MFGARRPESTASKDPPGKIEVAEVTEPHKPDAAAASDPCGAAALGLADAKKLEPWTPPPGCSPRGDGTKILRSDEDLRPRIECTAGFDHLVDFTRSALLAVGHTLSPAGAGMIAFDDGELITRVTLQRDPCPDAPMPMPMQTAAWFLLPVGAERSFADKTCTLASSCR